MDDDYFSIDSILAENQKIQFTFREELSNLGSLLGGTERDVKVNSKVAIPLWLAYTVIYSNWADFTIPQPFTNRVKSALKAEARSVKLSNQVGAGGLWYGFGRTIMNIVGDEQANDMSEMMTAAFHRRLPEVMDQAQHFAASGPAGGSSGTGDPAQAFREGLDGTERELFSVMQASCRRTKEWYEEKNDQRR